MDFSSEQIQRIRSHLVTGGDHIGDVVWWTLADARVARAFLQTVWAQAGLAENHLPEAPTPEKALKTAIRDCQAGQPDRLVRLGKETETELIYSVVREQRHDNGSVSFHHETRVLLDRAFGRLTLDDHGHDLAVAIRDGFDRLVHTHTSDDVRRAMIKVLDSSAAVTLREHGGVYWVPAPFAETLRRLQTAVEQIGSSRVYILPVHASDDASRTLGTVACASIESEIEQLRAEIDGFLSVPPERTSTLTRRLESFEALRAKAHLYRDVLRIQVTDLDDRIDRLMTTVEELLTSKAA